VLKLMRDLRWLKVLEGYQVNLLAIDIPEAEFDQAISQMVKKGELSGYRQQREVCHDV